MAKERTRDEPFFDRKRAMPDTPALRALRAALADFADIEVVAPAVKPKGIAARAIRKAVRDFYRDPKTLERA